MPKLDKKFSKLLVYVSNVPIKLIVKNVLLEQTIVTNVKKDTLL